MLSSDQIKQALELYLKRTYTQYAIVVDGGWGVGKTHLVVNTILPEIEDIHFLHISLYGLSSISDIENEIFKCASLNPATRAVMAGELDVKAQEGCQSTLLGGVSYAVQVLLTRFQSAWGGAGIKLALCFDDLERWAGDLSVCLSYVNKIVEIDGIKSVLLANLNALDERGVQALSQAREKTIRHIYKFSNPVTSSVDYALTLVDYQSPESQAFTHQMIDANRDVLSGLLNRVGEKNIRTLGEAFQLYDYIVSQNMDVFRRTPSLSFTYFITLLSTSILLKKHFLHKEERARLFEGNYHENRGFGLLKSLGYFDDDSPAYITKESKILLDTIFYRLDEISLEGIFSIIENGFYLESAFESCFDQWGQDKQCENYLDKAYFYQLDEGAARTLIAQIMDEVFELRSIRNPATLLLVAERMLHDSRAKIIDLDPEDISQQFFSLFEGLYEAHEMDVVNLEHLQVQADRYVNSKALYDKVLGLNAAYVSQDKVRWHRSFWERLSSDPQNFGALLLEFDHFIFLKDATDPVAAMNSLETLSNAQLYQLARLLNDKLEEIDEEPFLEKYAPNAEVIFHVIEERYSGSAGIRANNMKEIAAVFRRMAAYAVIDDQFPQYLYAAQA